MGFEAQFNVPPGVAGGVNAGDNRESGSAGVCSPVAVPLPWLASSRRLSVWLVGGSDCGGSFGEAWAGRFAIATVGSGRGLGEGRPRGICFIAQDQRPKDETASRQFHKNSNHGPRSHGVNPRSRDMRGAADSSPCQSLL